MKKSLLFSTMLLLMLYGCNHNELDVDLSGIKTQPLRVMRLENDLFKLGGADFDARNAEIKAKYGAYYEHYLAGFLNRKGSGDSLYKPAVLHFINDRDVYEAYGYIKQLYPDEKLDAIAGEANDCVKRFKYHFPNRKVPTKLITCMSGWNYAYPYLDSALVVSLDMYLGDTAKFYTMLRLPAFQTRKMNAEHILPDLARGWLLTELDTGLVVNTLINHTVFYGKLYYAINALLPHLHDSLLIGYSGKQLAYCREYEKNLWGYFAEKNRLYANDLQAVRELTNDGPFTSAISKDCPPRIAMWVGWQVVKSYMKNNKDVTLEQLVNEPDPQKILSKSKYRP
jgi:hypothetical protein